ncbi:autophagy-related protein 2 homolog B [Contarinia nasturtii]|uniref:autophagy-related protein 2 homolog B n=1 Tax=Contarinia nasturtii TaxID=265458 RepID=UPI0012D413F0|nr:autophagy-related protein 2 homolog B [Contarinia nasturtii]
MTFWFAPFTDLVKKKVCRYLLHRYLGSFIHEKISLDQLNVDFYNGKGTISNIVLDPEALNDLCENQGWDIEVIAGHIGRIDVNIPWNALMSEDSFVEITDLYFEIRPKCRPKDGASMIESMWSSMSSSMQLAKDCLEHESGPNPPNQPMEGLERFAQIIDNVLNRIKVRLIDTEIRLEYFTSEKERGITVVCKIKSFEYKNEAGGDPPDKPANAPDVDSGGSKSYSIPVYSTHQLVIENIAFYMEEFRISNGKKGDMMKRQHIETSPVAEQYYSTMSELPDITHNQMPINDEVSSCSDDDNDNASDISDISRTEALQIASFSGKTDIKITVKQTPSVQGPKVQLELQLGAVNIFLTPRQLHALIKLADIYLNDSTNQKMTVPNLSSDHHPYHHHHPDNDHASEYKAFNAMSGNLGLNQCWSSDPVSAGENQHQNQNNTPLDIDTIRETNSMSNSITSFASGYTQTTIRNRRRGVIEIDPNAEILRTNIRVASCAILLLQEDILVESPPNEHSPLNENSVRKLQQISETFFDTIEDVNMNSAKDLKSIMSVLDFSCKRNHIRLVLTPILIEGEEQRNNSGILLRLSISIPRADLREIMKDASVPILEFHRDSSGGTMAKRPEINILLKQTTNVLGNSCGLSYEAPKTEISFMLAPCSSEFDISIIDRLSPVFNGSPFSTNNDHFMKETTIHQEVQMSQFSLTLESPSIDIRLRFPCTDLRPIHTPDRVPWWKRNVLRDSLYIKFGQAKLTYHLNKYEIVANKIDIYYSENDDEQKIHIGNIITYEQPTKHTSESPRIVIEIPTLETIARNLQKQQPSDDSSDGGHHSEFSFNMSNSNEPTPFSAKHVWRESDTPHAKTDDANRSQNLADDEKLLIPGDITEMNDFCDDSEATSKLKIIVSLPVVSLQLRSKHMYEVIYNRIISNILLWVPSAPNNNTTKQTQVNVGANNPLLNINMAESISIPFSMAKSNIIFDSSSATNSDSDTDSENIFYSAYNESKRAQQKPQLASVTQSSACSFRLNIGQGLLTAYSPVRDSANRVIPGQQGEFVIKLENGSLFSVSSFRGDENLNYMCVQASAVEMYHIGLVPVPSSNPPLRLYGCVLPSHVQSTIYPTPSNLTVDQAVGKKASNREMISIAVQVKSVPERKVKRIKVSAGLQLATLRYNSALPEHMWLRQIMDMFNVEDYPIQGYTPLTNIMEMHLHLWDCSVDYRPRFYDYRAVLAINTFMMSTTLSSTNNGCTVRFVAEDGTLSLAPQTQPGEFKFKNENKITSLPSSELVCVFEFALLEISLRESDKVTEFAPKYDARASMNGTHLRVCADSCKALGNLIAYIAAEGDLSQTKEQDDENVDSLVSSSKDLDEDLIAVNAQNIPEVTEDQQQRVNQLMEEAMQDCVREAPYRITPVGDSVFDEDSETFYFPDETNPTDKSNSAGISSSRKGLPNTQSNTSLNKDDEDTLSNITDCSRRRTTDLQDIIDFENSVMGLNPLETEAVEALPLVDSELGTIPSPDSKKKSSKKPSRIEGSDTDDEFCFIGDEERPKYGIDNVLPTDEPIRIVDNHFSIPLDKHDMLKAPQAFPQAVTRYTICDLSISMHLYGGNDFATTNSDKEKEYEKASNEKAGMSDAYKKGVAFSKISSTVTLPSKVKSNTPRSQRPWKERGGLNRNFEVCVEIHSNKSRFSHETYPAHSREASRQVLVLSDFEVWDRLSSSSFNKMFYTGRNERSKKSDQATMYIKCIFIRPEPTLPSQEANLFISFMPKVNINIDQDTMLFIADFFAQLNGSEDEPKPTKPPSTPTHQPPVMIVDMPDLKELQARKMVDKNLMLLIDDDEENGKEKPPNETASNVTDNNPVYFRSVTFSPEVELTINYCGKRVQFTHGPIMGLIMGLSHLNCSRIRLKKIHYRRGLLGIDKVLCYLIKEWLNHIQNSQLPSLLQGIGPMNSIVIFFQGVIDLFLLPYKQYQRDGRIVRGIQLGAQSFTSRTALAALELTTRLIYLLQITAETAYDMVSPMGPSVRISKRRHRGKRKIHRPQDIREGVTNAYHIVKDGVGNTAQNIVEMATIEHDQKGVTGAVGAVIRQIPPSIVMPIVLATQATANVLGGVRNQLVPDAQIEAKEKWKEDDD